MVEVEERLGLINSLFGDTGTSVWSVGVALLIVIVLIVFLVWLLKFVLNASRSVARGRNRRIGVTESVMVDTKRQLVLIRRDDVEHLVLTGGPQDLIVEADIPLIAPDALAVPSRRPPPVSGEFRHTEPAAPHPEEPPVAASARPSFAAASLRPPVSAGSPAPARPQAVPSSRVAGLVPPGQIHHGQPTPEPRVSPIEKLRQLAERGPGKGVAALRYPGLLKPVTRHRGLDPAPVNKTDPASTDSDMSLSQADETGDSGSVDGHNGDAGDIANAGKETKSQG